MSTPDPTDQQALEAARTDLQAARIELQGVEAQLLAALADTEDDE
ncbi:hypothetical protein [Kribbella antibiotica]|nr:hypothetical protein [Kribbella antibiotica]